MRLKNKPNSWKSFHFPGHFSISWLWSSVFWRSVGDIGSFQSTSIFNICVSDSQRSIYSLYLESCYASLWLFYLCLFSLQDVKIKLRMLDCVFSSSGYLVSTCYRSRNPRPLELPSLNVQMLIPVMTPRGSGCNIAAEHTPHNQKVGSSNPAEFWAFFNSLFFLSLTLSLSGASLNRSLEEVQHHWFSAEKWMLCSAAWGKTHLLST